jgi:hypothetical protein
MTPNRVAKRQKTDSTILTSKYFFETKIVAWFDGYLYTLRPGPRSSALEGLIPVACPPEKNLT